MSLPQPVAMARSAPRSATMSLLMRCPMAPGTNMAQTAALSDLGHIPALQPRRRVPAATLPSVMLVPGAVLLSTAAFAQTTATVTKGTGMEKVDSQAAPPPTGLTGDWGGMRTQLHDAGIDAAASYVSETAYNHEGGSSQMVRETGQFALGFTADMAALARPNGGPTQITLTQRPGATLGASPQLRGFQ